MKNKSEVDTLMCIGGGVHFKSSRQDEGENWESGGSLLFRWECSSVCNINLRGLICDAKAEWNG
jgi:hypothetical protein